ncbi:MAG TPA: hypothetical protein VNV62_10920 [Trebonia sp.]|nr:hypothetical protein [Trebonia sp.]
MPRLRIGTHGGVPHWCALASMLARRAKISGYYARHATRVTQRANVAMQPEVQGALEVGTRRCFTCGAPPTSSGAREET